MYTFFSIAKSPKIVLKSEYVTIVDIFAQNLEMEFTVRFYLLNAEFSEEQAQDEGGENENNYRYEWEDELKVTTFVSDVKVKENEVFPLAGETAEGESFSFDILDMTLFQLEGESPVTLACSAQLIDSYEVNEDQLEVYIKDYEPMANPIPGVYIASRSFPEALIEE